MTRILVVEDEDNTRKQLKCMLSEANESLLKNSFIASTKTVIQAQRMLSDSLTLKRPFDVVILDTRLPWKTGDNPEADFSLDGILQDYPDDPIVVHITSYPNDERVQEYRKNKNAMDQIGRIFLSKESGWSPKLIKEIISSLHERRIRDKMRRLRSDEDSGAGDQGGRRTAPAGRSDAAMRHRFSDVCVDIANHWQYLRDPLRDQIRNSYGVVKRGDEVIVGVIIEPKTDTKESGESCPE